MDSNSRLTAEDREQIQLQLVQLAEARPTAPGTQSASPPQTPRNRRLSPLELAKVRRVVTAHALPQEASEVVRQIAWSVEEGTLAKFVPALAINIALKKVREGAWAKPHRLPPQWRRYWVPANAVAEPCTRA